MVIPSRLPEYIVAAMVIILAPGPSVLFVIARAIAWGRKTAVFTVAGNVTGAFALSTLVAVGLGPILQRSDLAYAAIQWGGGLYLMYLGVEAIRQRKVHAEDMRNQGDIAPGIARSMRDGFWVGALNPKGLVFYAAVLPQFVDREKGSVALQLILLGAVFLRWNMGLVGRNCASMVGNRCEEIRETTVNRWNRDDNSWNFSSNLCNCQCLARR